MSDIIIIGSGPAGLTAAIYAKRAKLSAIVIEKDYMGSGQIAASEQVDNYPGLPNIGGYELGEAFRAHALSLGAEITEGEVCAVSPYEKGWKISLKDGREMLSRAVIYAAGTSYRHLNIEGENKLGVSFCAVCDGAFYKDKTVAVIGGGDTALGDALYISKIAKKVYLIHRRNEFRANKALQDKVKAAENIELVLEAVTEEILGDSHVRQLKIKQNGNEKIIDADGIFIAVGSVPNTQILENICDLDPNGYVFAGEDCVTSAEGLFAAGDIRRKPLRQVITAAADGATSVISAEKYLNEQG